MQDERAKQRAAPSAGRAALNLLDKTTLTTAVTAGPCMPAYWTAATYEAG